MFFVDTAHQRGRWRQYLVNEDKNGFLWRELDSFADDIDKLSNRQICRNQILLLVDGRDIGLLDLFADYLVTGRVSGEASEGAEMARIRESICILECGLCTSGEYAQLPPCASRRGARP